MKDISHVWDVSTISEKVAAFIRELCESFSERQPPKDFLFGWLHGEPTLGHQDSPQGVDLVAIDGRTFNLWFFAAHHFDRTALLRNLRENAHQIQEIRGTTCENIILHHESPPRRDIIPFLALEQLESAIPTTSAVETRNAKKIIEPAAVVVLDIEGQFRYYIDELAQLLNRTGTTFGLRVRIETSFRALPEDSCLAFDELQPLDLTYFTPDLSMKSQDSFKTALTHALATSPTGFCELIERVEGEIENGVRNSQIRAALGRTISSLRRVHSELYDKETKNPLRVKDLLIPGRITVLDVSSLSEDNQRYVAIYLLTILHNSKMVEKEPGRIVLFIDEAHKMFPRSPPTQYKDFYQRIYSFISDIVHKGRKRRYGVVIATQQPKDVADAILSLPDTKVIFEVEGERRWMSEMLPGKPHPRGVGHAGLVLKGPPTEPLLITTPDIMGLLRNKNRSQDHTSTPTSDCQGDRVGYIIQREKTPLRYRTNGGQVYANIPLKNAPLIIPPQIVVAKGDVNGHTTTLFCEVREILRAFEIRRFTTSKTEDGLKDFTSEDYETTIVLIPRREISTDGYDGPFRNQDYSNVPVFLPTDSEVRSCFNLSDIGIPLGEFTVSEPSGHKIAYFLPYNPLNFHPDESEWQIDHSVMVVGSQGRGKTNFLVYFACLLASNSAEELGTRIIQLSKGS